RFGPDWSWPPSALLLTFTALAGDEAGVVLEGPAMPFTFAVTAGGAALVSSPKSAAWTPAPNAAAAQAAATRMPSALMDCMQATIRASCRMPRSFVTAPLERPRCLADVWPRTSPGQVRGPCDVGHGVGKTGGFDLRLLPRCGKLALAMKQIGRASCRERGAV